MPGTTPELNLSTALDSDDNADYLTLSLANSLRTVDGLFSSTTGHTHSGAHQGGSIGTIPAGSIPDGSITSAKLADGTVATADIGNDGRLRIEHPTGNLDIAVTLSGNGTQTTVHRSAVVRTARKLADGIVWPRNGKALR